MELDLMGWVAASMLALQEVTLRHGRVGRDNPPSFEGSTFYDSYVTDPEWNLVIFRKTLLLG
jgi:hypothetical protein